MLGRLIFVLLWGAFPLLAQESAAGPVISCPGHALEAAPGEETAFRHFRISAQPSSKFIPTYYSVPDSVQVVVEAAFDVWDKILINPIPIHIDVYWESMSGGTLASAGSDRVFKNFKNAPLREVWYPSALADALAGESVNKNNPDIVLRINRNAEWNLDYTGAQNYRYYDMLSVIIHEIAHGIGFMSSFEASGSGNVKWGIQNLPFVYDRYIVNQEGHGLVDNRFYTSDSEALYKAVTEEDVFFQIDSGAHREPRPRLHTENPFSSGASLSHISSRQNLQPDNGDRLMLPSLSLGARYHFPGNGILAILFQMGWALNFYEFEREYGYATPAFSLFPNPGSDYIYLKIDNFNPETPTQYHLLDATGKILIHQTVREEETEISLKMLPSGRYFLRIGEHSLPVIKL